MDSRDAKKILDKVIKAGFDSEKAIEGIKLEDIPRITGITISEVGQIVMLQKALKERKIVEFLAGKEEGE